MTKFFEQNGPTASLLIREYVKLRNSVQKKIDSTQSRADPLFPLHHAILVRIKTYLAESLQSHTLILATILHPSLRMDYFEYAFGENSVETSIAKQLIESAYAQKKGEVQADASHNNPSCTSTSAGHGKSLGEEDEAFRTHKERNRRQTANELRSYLEMAEEPAPEVAENPHLALEWWRVCDFCFLSSILFNVDNIFLCTGQRGQISHIEQPCTGLPGHQCGLLPC